MDGLINKISGPDSVNGVSRINFPVTTGRIAPSLTPPVTDTGKTFRELLESSLKQKEDVTFSKHAIARADARGVTLSETDMHLLNQAVGKAEDKGITNSLVYLNDTAFIVNIPNRVVVTVVDSADTGHSVFTNIDGAVII